MSKPDSGARREKDEEAKLKEGKPFTPQHLLNTNPFLALLDDLQVEQKFRDVLHVLEMPRSNSGLKVGSAYSPSNLPQKTRWSPQMH